MLATRLRVVILALTSMVLFFGLLAYGVSVSRGGSDVDLLTALDVT